MLAPHEVQTMLALQALGWGSKRISRELGCSRNTVREYLRQGGWRPMDVAARSGVLEPHRQWLAERLRQHRGNADVVRQDLAREFGIRVSLRTVQRAVEPVRRELRAEAVATVRYETAPGHQLQIDFGSTAVVIGQEPQRIRTPEWAQPICGIPAAQIRRVAAKLGAAAPQVGVWMSRGMHMNRRGAYASMCGHALSGLLGATDNEGGTLRYQSAPRAGLPSVTKYQDAIAQAGVKHEVIDRRGRLELPAMAAGRPGSGVVANQIADSMLSGDPYPIEVVLAYLINYPFSAPGTQRWEEALAKVPFTAHVTTNISELTWYADVVLPANHHMFEAWGINDSAGEGYGHLGLHQPLVKRLNGGVDVELGVPWLLGLALEKKGFPNLANYLRSEFVDPERRSQRQPTSLRCTRSSAPPSRSGTRS